MAGIAVDVEASCAICGAPPYPECPHEGQRLKLALEQAMARWAGVQSLRDWVLNHARNQVIATFQQLKAARWQAHQAHLHTLPCYTLYQKWQGNPPIPPAQLHQLHAQVQQAQALFRAGVDEDWRRSCLRYPEVLDYYFSLVELSYPHDRDPSVQEPRFGGPAAAREPGMLKARRGSVHGERKKEKKSSRGRTPPPPPPAAPMPGNYRR